MKKIITLSLFTALVACSCGGEKSDAASDSTANNTNSNAQASASNSTPAPVDAGAKKLAERRAKGDTLAMPWSELIKYLPTKLDGYEVEEEPTGTTTNMPGMSLTNAEAIFKKGNDVVKISLIDYNAAYGMYQAATMVWASGMSVDSPDESASGVKLDNDIVGWQDYHKKTREVSLTLGVGYRFWLQIDSDNQDGPEWTTNLAKSMDLAKLASL
ncbi:MAG TPA: hypothetical protein VL651_13550 [Bacteroidia bacterium]|jgi:hypothetical protein|nr:hypothetical protein [Bacteroidia bacterium]